MQFMLTRRVVLSCIAAFGLGATAPAMAQDSGEITVFAAASLTNALQEAGEAFAKDGGAKVKFSFASSSALAKQIESGAKAQIFASADEKWMDHVEKANLIENSSRRPLLGNRLALVVPSSAPLTVDLSSKDWLSKIPQGRIATGDPAHVPVGRYAQQALTKMGAWADVEPRLARADNVRNALALVERGEAVAGIVYSTDAAVAKQVATAGTFPEASHEAIVYPFAILKGEDKGDARKFFDFLASDKGKAIFTKYGFSTR